MNSGNRKSRARSTPSLPLVLLGGISAGVFLRDYWQKKPLLIRNAIAQFTGPLTKTEVLTLARRDEAESRLITHAAGTWQLEHGPFSPKDFRKSKDFLWTVLVQDVQHFSHEAHELLDQFNFIPRARIDDLMVSYAVPGAGVGAHVDSYDVFLLQGIGRRRWQISEQQNLRLQPDVPLKILSHFKPSEEFVLETGDMLYLPPSVAHNGIAETECLTWSIGFRAPTKQELSVAFLDHLRDSIQLTGRYADPDIESARHPAEIDTGMRERLLQLLRDVQIASRAPENVRVFIGCYLTEPKPHVVLDPPLRPLSARAFSVITKQRGVELALTARILYDDEHLFINGVAHMPINGTRNAIHELADKRSLSVADLNRLSSEPLHDFLHKLYCDGALLSGRF